MNFAKWRALPACAILLLPLSVLAQPTPPPSYKDLKFPPLREIQMPKIDETVLPNGMKVYLLENHELPLVRGTALVRTGNLFDPADKVGLATITGETIRSGGTTAKTGDQIDEQLENIAASVESSIDESFGRVSFSTLKERTDEVMAVFHDVITAPAFRDNKIDLVKSQLRSGISRRNDEAEGISQREFTDTIYGKNTPYGWQIEYATLDNIKRDDILAFLQTLLLPCQHHLSRAGRFLHRRNEGEDPKPFRIVELPAAARAAVPEGSDESETGCLSRHQDRRYPNEFCHGSARRHFE
jgi:zinc protease